MEESKVPTPTPPPEEPEVPSETPPETPPASSPEISPAASPLPIENEDHVCKICDEKFISPHILSCLHVYCAACLEKQIEGTEEHRDKGELEGSLAGAKKSAAGTIICPECKQETAVGPRGVDGLPQDYVIVNMMDMVAIEEKQIICTSCKAKEKAVARCSDCANFLCPNCVTAHQYMRCFENHKVVSFDELKDAEGGMSLHKPLFCQIHASESMKYYCTSCQVPMCNECMVGAHKQPNHVYERISDEDTRHMNELKSLMGEAENKVEIYQESSVALDGSLRELQMQRDNARSLVQETFQSYKAILEKCQETMLEELEEIHSTQELSIMEMFHTVEKTMEKIEDGCKFMSRILEHGNNVEILSLKKLMTAQMLSLINNTPKLEADVKIDFVTHLEAFEDAVKHNFGHFVKPDSRALLADTPGTSLHSSFENEGIKLPPGVLSPALRTVPASDFMMPPISLPSIAPIGSSPAPSLIGVSQQTINSIASSLQNLPTAAERSSSRNSYSPAMSDSGISVDAASNSSGSNQAANLANLAKLGAVNVNSQGQITLNGTVIPGLNINNTTGIPPSVSTNRVPTPTPPTPEPNLSNLLTNININPPPSMGTPILSMAHHGRSQTPHLHDIAGLLSQTSPPLNGLGSLPGATSTAPPTQLGLMSQSAMSPVSSGVSQPSPGFGSAQQPPFPVRSNKMNAMQIRCKFGQLGPGKGQFNSPHGFCLGFEEDIIVADTNNHRIQVFEKTGEFKYQFGIPGREEGQLWYPRKVAVVRHSGKYVVCDRGNERSRMQIFTKNGHFIKKIAIRYIDIVAGLAVTPQGHIVAVDSVSPTVFVIGESGDLIKWFDCSDYMREPSDIAVDGKDYFVCDFKGHCVVVFNEDGQFVRRIGCENITNYPNGIDISDAGDVLVGDSHGNRFHVGVFQRDGSLIGEFECPYVKVSRCCGLKITMEGYVVTLAKNNHHVLVLNTLYIT